MYDNDGGGNTTIGYGHLVHRGLIDPANHLEDPYKNGISQPDAERLLRGDLGGAEKIVRDHVRVPLSQNQFDALCSLVFNIKQQFDSSTLLRFLNIGDYRTAAEHFKDWHFSNGHDVKGLRTRREDEKELFRRR